MSSLNPLIRLDGVGKCYRIYQNPQDRFKQALQERFGNWFSKRNNARLYREHWALRDVNLEIYPGEVVGILGRNGAGKSTLLQIVAGTLTNTTGIVETNGRITALLELGSGFNPELTGRENVYHNAQILGVDRDEITARFSQIASFADIGDFIEQPVKTYSSGMMMRLAFSVQTILDPSILIVDEALAVGDARFQEKCFRRLKQLRDCGVAILLVTHDVNSVTTFCDRAILMDGGRILNIDTPDIIAHQYVNLLYTDNASGVIAEKFASKSNPEKNVNIHNLPALDIERDLNRFGNKKVEVIAVGVTDEQGVVNNLLTSGRRYVFKQILRVNEKIEYLSTGFTIKTIKNVDIFGYTNKSCGQNLYFDLEPGTIIETTMTVELWLAAGEYILHLGNADESGVQYDCVQSALIFKVIGTPSLFTTSIVNLNPSITVNFNR